MNPVLLSTDTATIEDQQETLANSVGIFQTVYNALKAINITPTITEINTLVVKTYKTDVADFVKDYVINKLIAAAGPVQIGVLTLTADAVRNFIQPPDFSGVLVALAPIRNGELYAGNAKGVEVTLLSLNNDVISAVAGASDTIAAKYTILTKTDASATLATQLQAVADALNNFNGLNKGFFTPKVGSVPGLELSADKSSFIISSNFIQKFENSGALNFNV